MIDFLTSNLKLTCPCCNQSRTNQDLTSLLKFDLEQRPTGVLRFITCVKQAVSDWACDICIQSSNVILANPDLQNANGITHPCFIYRDKNINCERCSKTFVFSA